MAKLYPLAAAIAFFSVLLTSCSRDKYAADVPVYFSIPDMKVDITDGSQGTSHHKITTVWLYVNQEHQGTYELPCTVPVLLPEGNNDIRLYPGINLNGVSSNRLIYEFYNYTEFQYQHSPNNESVADTFSVPEAGRTTSYKSSSEVVVFEDFDGGGLNLENTPVSDTGIVKTNDPEHIFVNPYDTTEDNEYVGVLYTNASFREAEVATVNTYNLPTTGDNVYVELTYKCNIPFYVGVIANDPVGTRQQPTVRVNPRSDWNKIYINLITELSAFATANNYKIYIHAGYDSSVDTGKVYLDNLKLVY